jgi:hypothetical protein
VLFLDPIKADRISQSDRPVGGAQIVRKMLHVDPLAPTEDDRPFANVSARAHYPASRIRRSLTPVGKPATAR